MMKEFRGPGLLIIILFISLLKGFGQSYKTDSTQFKKELEQLMTKYGLDNNAYLINVKSINQKGGQTAFVINNNYYGDSTKQENNLLFEFIEREGKTLLYVAPKNGVWLSPYVATDSAKWTANIFPLTGQIGFMTDSPFLNNDKWHTIGGVIDNNMSCSQRNPMVIHLTGDPEQLYVFGDFNDYEKTYKYFKGKVEWVKPFPK